MIVARGPRGPGGSGPAVIIMMTGPRPVTIPRAIIATGRTIRSVSLARTTGVYRGNDGRYYCKRNDGTTGLIVGAARRRYPGQCHRWRPFARRRHHPGGDRRRRRRQVDRPEQPAGEVPLIRHRAAETITLGGAGSSGFRAVSVRLRRSAGSVAGAASSGRTGRNPPRRHNTSPSLRAGQAFDDRVPGRVEMLGRMAIGRIVAATDMAAGPAQAQMHPPVAGLQTFLAPVGARRDILDTVQMRA